MRDEVQKKHRYIQSRIAMACCGGKEKSHLAHKRADHLYQSTKTEEELQAQRAREQPHSGSLAQSHCDKVNNKRIEDSPELTWGHTYFVNDAGFAECKCCRYEFLQTKWTTIERHSHNIRHKRNIEQYDKIEK